MTKKNKGLPEVNTLLDEGEEFDEEAALKETQEKDAEVKAEAPEKEEAKGEEAPEKKHEAAIPYERFQEQTKARAEAEKRAEAASREAAELREKWARLDAVQKVAENAQKQIAESQAAAKAAKERPDPDLDPQGAKLWDTQQMVAQLQAQVALQAQQFQGAQQQGVQSAQEMQFQMWTQNAIAQARAADPQHDAKVDGLKNVFRQMWQAAGRPAGDAEVIMNATERALVETALQSGTPLNVMVGRIGQNVQEWANALMAANPTPNGQSKVASPKAADKIAQITKGQAAQGLGRVQSGGELKNNDWENMSSEEFRDWVANLNEDEFNHISGGPNGNKLIQKTLALG
jgi:myosin heavy subunit